MMSIRTQTMLAALLVPCAVLGIAFAADAAGGGDCGCAGATAANDAGSQRSSNYEVRGGGGTTSSHAGLDRYAYIEVHCPEKAKVFINGHSTGQVRDPQTGAVTENTGEYRIFRTFIPDDRPRYFKIDISGRRAPTVELRAGDVRSVSYFFLPATADHDATAVPPPAPGADE